MMTTLRKNSIASLGIIYIVMILCITWMPAFEHAYAANIEAPMVFTGVAEKVIPTVVFIEVEQTIEAARAPFQYNNPFDLFEDDVLKSRKLRRHATHIC